jgi:DNA-binding NarL/FixJ family response regulator
MTAPRISVAILEDEPSIRHSLEDLLGSDERIELKQAFQDGEMAVKVLSAQPVDVLLCDINLPGISGIEVIARLKARHAQMQCVVLSAFEDIESIFKALRAGATGYILKSQPFEQVEAAILEVHAGGSPMSSGIARKVVSAFTERPQPAPEVEQLSRREQEILELLSKGFRYKEIAARIFVSVETVRTHIHNIYVKLQVNTRQDALRKAGLF